jgi:Cdc6-like AAA superfamily ATPase
LEKEQEQSVVYGSTDFGKTCATNEKYRELVNKQNIFKINLFVFF